jgi:hypothetical protein
MNAKDALEQAYKAEPGACHIWPLGRDAGGYGRVGAIHGHVLAHRVVCEAAHGAPPEGKPNALHNCGNPSCVNPHHLRWGTQSENRGDMRLHGTLPVGRANGAAKLSDDQVRRIREVSARGASQRELARSFGVGVATICNIVNRKAWAHVS